MSIKRLVVAACVAVGCAAPAQAQSNPAKKPAMSYAGPGIAHLRSEKPYPDAHVRCVRIIDGFAQWSLTQKGLFSQTFPANNGRFKPKTYSDALANFKASARCMNI